MTEPFGAIEELIYKYRNGTISDEERVVLNRWRAASPQNETLFEQLTGDSWINGELKKIYTYDEDRGWEKIRPHLQETRQAQLPAPKGKLRRMYVRLAAAACIMGIIATGIYYGFFAGAEGNVQPGSQIALQQDIPAPATNRATITLADRTVIYLDSSLNGELALQGNARLVKLDNGRIAYEADLRGGPTGITSNTLTNPRGSRVIDMKLADGSRVWLNAGSSITYPVSFGNEQRKVSITGEAYFEIAPDKKRPFLVAFSSGNREGTVEVLGTHFNVNAYHDESSAKITLLEGAVKVSSKAGTCTLQPGQQAALGQQLQVISKANLEEVMAWKTGKFYFRKADIHTAMRQIARWYDVEIVSEGNIEGFFNGTISRDENVSTTLKKLQLTGEVQFEIKDKKIMVKQ